MPPARSSAVASSSAPVASPSAARLPASADAAPVAAASSSVLVAPPSSRKPRCIFHLRGYCRTGPACPYSHEPRAAPSSGAPLPRRPRKSHAVAECGICFESPGTRRGRYGLLIGCDHPFCLECIVKWRKDGGGNCVSGDDMRRTCPTCREKSNYVVPSFEFVTGEEKRAVVEGFKRGCASIRCKYYGREGGCPFELGCFYAHVNPDGSVVDKAAKIAAGEDTSEGRARARREAEEAREAARAQGEVALDIVESVAREMLGNLGDGVLQEARAGVGRAVSSGEGGGRRAATEIQRIVETFLDAYVINRVEGDL